MKTKIVSTIKQGIVKAMLVGVAALVVLATVMVVRAEPPERYRSFTFQNTGFGTAYYQLGGSNVVMGSGYQVYQGGTNAITVTNGTIYSPSTAVPQYLGDFQNVPFTLELATVAAGNGTSNTTAYVDVSPDNINWITNYLAITVAQNGTNNVFTVTNFPMSTVGTNVLSPYRWWRWGGIGTTQTNGVEVLSWLGQVYR